MKTVICNSAENIYICTVVLKECGLFLVCEYLNNFLFKSRAFLSY